jgi:hypothetical protein
MVIAAVFFFGSLIGIAVLFGIKYWEVHHGRTMVPARVRTRADRGALRVKTLLDMAREEAQRIPPAVVYIVRLLIHETALGTAMLARTLERQAHRLADFVSHKHRFERRESRSEFLRQMNGHALRDPRDTTSTDTE